MADSKQEWLPYPVNILFKELIRGKVNSAVDESKNSTGIPYVGATDRNNGVMDFLAENKKKEQPGNCITFIRDGQGSVGSSVYRATPCIATVNTSSGYADWMTEETGLFVSTCSNANRNKYSFGYKRNESRLMAERIMLPATSDGTPDWNYMSSVVNDIREKLLVRYKNYVTTQLSEMEYEKIPELAEMEWRPFHVSRVFTEIGRGKRLKKADHIPGNIPYVSSTAMNNGVDAFITATPGTRVFSDCLSLANSGSVGSTFYEPFDYVASDHVTHLKHDGFNKWVYLFLVAVVEKQGVNFNFNREINDTRINKMQIMLPVADNGKPDYNYMEQYAKNLMFRKYNQYLAYARHEKT